MSDRDQPIPHLTDEIRTLIHRSFDESLSEKEVRKIERALSFSAEARGWYVQLVQMHADLSTVCGAYEVCKYVQEEFPQDHEAEPSLHFDESKGSPGRMLGLLGGRWISNYAAAALMLLGIVLGCGVTLFASTLLRTNRIIVPVPWNWRVDDEVVAKLKSTHNAEWQTSESPETLPTCGLRIGQKIRLAKGIVSLAFRDGVEILLEGPVLFEVRNKNGGKLYTGRLAATVPSDNKGFHVETRIGRFQLGPGEFGIQVDEIDGELSSETHVFSGIAPGVPAALFVSSQGEETSIRANEAMSFNVRGEIRQIPLAMRDSFPVSVRPLFPEPYRRDTIYLGNLFDDSKSASLTTAMQTDEYQAAGETIDLGVAAVHDGGLDVDVSLAEDGVRFNLLNVGGGGPAVNGLPANDTYRSVSRIPIRTTGEDFGTSGPLPKVEEGIGISANELLTFDLQEIRDAGNLAKQMMWFVSDRAGINDRENPLETSRDSAEANFVVIVSTEDEVLSAYVNGQLCEVVEHSGVYSFDLDSGGISPPLRYDGRFTSFDVPLPPAARFLTLATTMIDVEHHDHCVFSGARLELLPAEERAAKENSHLTTFRSAY